VNPSDIMNPLHPASPLNPANMQYGTTGGISDGVAFCILAFVVLVFVLVGSSFNHRK
jgi:hypothetical protein